LTLRYRAVAPREVADGPASPAWYILPFDGNNRGPAERAALLKRLGRGFADVRLVQEKT